MECVHPTAHYWRNQVLTIDDAELARDLGWLWESNPRVDAEYGRTHHDYVTARGITLREARKRGFNVSNILARLGT